MHAYDCPQARRAPQDICCEQRLWAYVRRPAPLRCVAGCIIRALRRSYRRLALAAAHHRHMRSRSVSAAAAWAFEKCPFDHVLGGGVLARPCSKRNGPRAGALEGVPESMGYGSLTPTLGIRLQAEWSRV